MKSQPEILPFRRLRLRGQRACTYIAKAKGQRHSVQKYNQLHRGSWCTLKLAFYFVSGEDRLFDK